MNITILDNRDVITNSSENVGTQNENNATILNFSFPEKLINASKKIVFVTEDGVFEDIIEDNTYKLKNSITKYKTVSANVCLIDTQNEIDFRSRMWEMNFNLNEKSENELPDEEPTSIIDTIINRLDNVAKKVEELEDELNESENKINELEDKIDYLYDNYTVTVTFQHSDETVISTGKVALGETLAFPNNNILNINKVFAGWTLNETNYTGSFGDTEFYANGNSLSDAIKELTSEKQNVILTSYYEDSSNPFYTVNATGGKILYNNVEIENGSLIESGEKIHLIAEVPEEKYMHNWLDKNNTIISYKEECNYYIYADGIFTAEFADTPLETIYPVIYWSNNKYDVDLENHRYTKHLEVDIPQGYIRIEWGYIYTTNKAQPQADELVLTLETVDDDLIKKMQNVSSAEVWNNTSAYTLVDNLFKKKFRGYMIIIEPDGTESIYYSDYLTVEIEE